MFVTKYFSENNAQISFSRQQASHFAKHIANDFNPIHDEDAQRFCVPGDLLFSTVLYKQGLSQKMRFEFSGMVTEDVSLNLPENPLPLMTITGNNGKEYLTVARDGDITHDKHIIENLVRQYVAFSGQTFPHILVPLMQSNQVMINPDRPFVVYESMEIDFDHLNFTELKLQMLSAEMEVIGKRGNASLKFGLIGDGKQVGTGTKNMVLSGLRPYEQDKIEELIDFYNTKKQSHNNHP